MVLVGKKAPNFSTKAVVNGGEIIAQGTPEEIIKIKESYTGKYLFKYLN